MKKFILIVVFILPVFLIYSQDKKLSKIENYYVNGKYEKCITKAKSYLSENNKNAAPYYFIGMSYFQEYKTLKDNFSVKSAGKYINKGIKKENYEVYDEKFKTELDSFHLILRNFAANYYDANKKQSKPYFDYLAKIYKDTLKQYHEIFKEEEARPDAEIVRLTEEGKINQTDANGLKR